MAILGSMCTAKTIFLIGVIILHLDSKSTLMLALGMDYPKLFDLIQVNVTRLVLMRRLIFWGLSLATKDMHVTHLQVRFKAYFK